MSILIFAGESGGSYPGGEDGYLSLEETGGCRANKSHQVGIFVYIQRERGGGVEERERGGGRERGKRKRERGKGEREGMQRRKDNANKTVKGRLF